MRTTLAPAPPMGHAENVADAGHVVVGSAHVADVARVVDVARVADSVVVAPRSCDRGVALVKMVEVNNNLYYIV